MTPTVPATRPRISTKANPWAERPTSVERLAKWLVLGAISLSIIYPFVAVVGTSLASEEDFLGSSGSVLIPQYPSLAAYEQILAGGVVTQAIAVSIGITTIGTLLSLVFTSMLAYALSRPVVGRRPMVLLVLFTLLFNPGIIPNYLVVKELGLLNSYASLILPVLINGFYLVILRQFFMGIPEELIDSARIDGAGEVSVLLRIVLPLSTAILAVIALFYAVAYWNSFFSALLYLSDSRMWPLQLVVRQYVLIGSTSADVVNPRLGPPWAAVQMAIVVVAIVPILLVYPFLQRHFTGGVLTGAIKG